MTALASTVLSLAGYLVFGRRQFDGDRKSNGFNSAHDTQLPGLLGTHSFYQSKGSSPIYAAVEVLHKHPMDVFKTGVSMLIFSGATYTVCSNASLSGASRLVNTLLFSDKSFFQIFGEYLTYFTLKPSAEIGKGIGTEVIRATWEAVTDTVTAAAEKTQETFQAGVNNPDEAHILAGLRHNQHCMASDVCSSIISKVDHSPALSSYVLPGSILLAALGASAYLYTCYHATEESNDVDSSNSSPTDASPSSST